MPIQFSILNLINTHIHFPRHICSHNIRIAKDKRYSRNSLQLWGQEDGSRSEKKTGKEKTPKNANENSDVKKLHQLTGVS